MESTTLRPEPTAHNATSQVLDWRRAQLEEAGFEAEDADALAFHTEVDLHQALDLLRRGCPPKTALQILL